MTHVVLDNCIKCKHTDCVEVCPVDCFYEGPEFLTINPEECIDCAVCIPECPVGAIVPDDEIPDDGNDWVAINQKLANLWVENNITEKKDAPADAAEWDGVPDKLKYLQEYLDADV